MKLKDHTWPVVVLILGAIFVLTSCGHKKNESGASGEQNSQEQIEKLDVQPPNLGKTERQKTKRRIAVWDNSILQKPPYYEGKVPFKVTCGYVYLDQNERYPVYADYGDFRNEYIYDDIVKKYSAIATGAITFDKAGRVLAEAKFREIRPDDGIIIEEFHYDSSKNVTFYCKSEIDYIYRYKKTEFDQKGTKHHEYYFLWSSDY